ncbi:MAG: class IV adenylate cyclase [Patescibacteria group bacterium]
MKNVESKFKLREFDEIKISLKRIKAKYAGKLNQLDTYYYCQKGRLKIREINNRCFELIYYQRPDIDKPKISNLQVINLKSNQVESLKKLFKDAFGVKNIIKKVRYLWLYKNTRIHLDIVKDLGKFIELETIDRKISLKEAKLEHAIIIKLLSLSKAKRLSQSYCEIKI